MRSSFQPGPTSRLRMTNSRYFDIRKHTVDVTADEPLTHPCSLLEVRRSHRRLELGEVQQERRIDGDVRVGGELRNRQPDVPSVEINCLRTATIAASRCFPRAANASSRTERATTYCESGTPDVLVVAHPCHQRLALVRPTTRTVRKVGGDLRQRRNRDVFPLERAVEDHIVEWRQ
jgi:hypothetical protein